MPDRRKRAGPRQLSMTEAERKAVLFFTPFGEWQVHNQLDVTVAASLKLRGVAILYLICESFYQPCAITRGQQDCVRCRSTMAATLGSQSIEASPFSSFLTDADIAQAEVWVEALPDDGLASACFDGLPVGEWALSSVITQFRISQIKHLAHAKIMAVHRRFLRDTLLTFQAIGRALDAQEFEALFLFNGRFYPYRAALEAARRRGIRVLVHERGRVANSFTFFENENVFGLETTQRLIQAWSSYALTTAETRRMEEYFAHLIIGRSENWPSFYDQITSGDPYAVLDIPQGSRLIGFFTSSTDEFAFQPGYGDVRRQFELIEKVASVIAGTDTFLIVRHHPFMAGGVDIPFDRTAFEEAFRQMLTRAENVRIIMPADRLASYALFPYLTAAVVPFSSIATELMAFGVPTLVSDVSMIGFSEQFILRDWSQPSVGEAVRFVLSDDAEFDADRMRSFYRYCHTSLFRFSVGFRGIEIENFFTTSSRFANLSSLRPGNDPALDRVCDHLLAGGPVHAPPDPMRAVASDGEDSFIARQVALVSNRRRALRDRSVTTTSSVASVNLAVLIDDTTEGEFRAGHWLALANAGAVSIRVLDAGTPQDPLRQPLTPPCGTDAAVDFLFWCRRLHEALGDTEQGFVLVTNPHYRLHDTSIASIAEAISFLEPSRGSVICLSGWSFDRSDNRTSRFHRCPRSVRPMGRDHGGRLRHRDLGIV